MASTPPSATRRRKGPIRFRCPHCRALMRCPSSSAGTVYPCPGCQESICVPHVGLAPKRCKPMSKPQDSEDPPASPALLGWDVLWLLPVVIALLVATGTVAWYAGAHHNRRLPISDATVTILSTGEQTQPPADLPTPETLRSDASADAVGGPTGREREEEAHGPGSVSTAMADLQGSGRELTSDH